jgi:hypothetical protein
MEKRDIIPLFLMDKKSVAIHTPGAPGSRAVAGCLND